MDTLTETRKTGNKGYGLFALKPIKRGTIIYEEEPILYFHRPSRLVAPEDLESALKKLKAADQEAVLSLHENPSLLAASRLTNIFAVNCFGDENCSYLYLKTSRINHACIANVVIQEGQLIASKDIYKGQELEINYLGDRVTGWTAKQRKRLLQSWYGFECRCVACRPSKFMWLSNFRRRLIGHIRYALDGSPPEYSELENHILMQMPLPPIPRTQPLTAVQRVEYSFLLACLFEAEGHTSPSQVASLYTKAANSLGELQWCLLHVEAVKDIVFVESNRCIRAWYEKAIAISEAAFGQAYSYTKVLRSDWEDVRDKSMYTIGCVVLGEQKMRPHSGVGREPFAMRFGKTPIPSILTEQRCRALIERRSRSQGAVQNSSR